MIAYILVWTITTTTSFGAKTIDIDVSGFKTAGACMSALSQAKINSNGQGNCMRIELE